MQTFQCQLAPGGQALDETQLQATVQSVVDLQAQLVLLFGDARHFAEAVSTAATSEPTAAPVLRRILNRLSESAPNALVVGCSTAGEILGSQVLEGTLTLTALAFGHTRLQVCSLPISRMEDSHAVGHAVSTEMRCRAEGPLQHMWVLAPGVHVNGSALVKGLKEGFQGGLLPGISGGLAGDGGQFSKTWTLGPRGITSESVVAVGFSGGELVAGSNAKGGWEAFGPARRVTRAQGNVLLEMDHESALAIYRRYLGEYARDLPASGLLFPLQITQGPDEGLIRTILGIDEEQGSLILAGDVSEDSHVRLMHASAHHLVAAAEQAAARLRSELTGAGHALALLVSCVGRRIVMGDQTEEEVEAVFEALPPGTCVTGFYSNGELAAWNFVDDCRLHNQTMTISWLAERTSRIQK